MARDENWYYETVATELQQQQMKLGLWAKAYAETQGDESRTLAVYIQLRVQQLKEEDKLPTLQQRKFMQEKFRLDAEAKHHTVSFVPDITKVGRVREMFKWFGIIAAIAIVVAVAVAIVIIRLRS